MGFTIPNTSGLTYPDQAAPDRVDFDVMSVAHLGYGVLSGGAVTATGSSMVLTASSGIVSFAFDAVSASGSATVGTAHATLPRYDLVVVDSTGVVSILAGTAASAPVFPTLDTSLYVLLAAVYVPAAVTTLSSANLVDKRMLLNGQPGAAIDIARRTTSFDVQAVGTTATDVEGLLVVVPPQVRSYRLQCTCQIAFATGTAAANTVQQVNLTLIDQDAAVTVGYAAVTATQGSAAATRTINLSATIDVALDPNSVTKTYKIQAKLAAASVANWTSTSIIGGTLPDSGGVFPPILLTAVSL